MGKEWRVTPDSFNISWKYHKDWRRDQLVINSSIKLECDPERSPGGTVVVAERAVYADWITAPDVYKYTPSPLDVANSLEYLVERIRENFGEEKPSAEESPPGDPLREEPSADSYLQPEQKIETGE